jgi:hypothetical protein
MTETSTVQGLLLQEAQQEIAALRNDLYNTRRIAEDRRVSNSVISTENTQLKDKLSIAESTLLHLQHKLSAYETTDRQLAAATEENRNLQQELQLSVQARRVLQDELAQERKRLVDLGQAKAMLESDRSLLQKAKDDLAAQLRVANQRAQEAEQEQLNAEDEAASLRSELARLQQSEVVMGMTSVHAASLRMEDMPQVRDVHSDQSSQLRLALENERSRAAALLDSMNALRLETQSLKEQLVLAKQQSMAGPSTLSPQALVDEAVALHMKLQESDAKVCQLEEALRLAHAAFSQQRHLTAPAVQGRPSVTSSSSQIISFPETMVSASAPQQIPTTRQQQQLGGRPPQHHRMSSGGASEFMASGTSDHGQESLLSAELEKRHAQVILVY